jgi:CRP-like cAMP-binding protein/formate hydrogenlyase subunit 6/NADH:ubiquinone oxidoreductase subunit I
MSTTTIPMTMVSITIDGRSVNVPRGTSIWEAARVNGIRRIPALCHTHEMDLPQVGVCRVCMVQIAEFDKRAGRSKEPYWGASCVRECEEGMVVTTTDKALEETRRTLIEILLSDHPSPCARHRATGDCELEVLGEEYGILKPAFSVRSAHTIKAADRSNPDIAIDHSSCIVCDRCARACSRAGFDVIGRVGKGMLTSIGFDNGLLMKASDCVNCGECMISCPTGAITYTGQPPQRLAGPELSVNDILNIPLMEKARVSSAFVSRSQGGIAVRRFRKGEVICRQGEYGRTAFYVTSGKVDVYIEKVVGEAQREARPSFLSRLLGFGKSPTTARSEPTATTRIPTDSSITLDPGTLVGQLGEGELFGELSCLEGQPRSATVRAAEDTEVVEMFRNYLDVLMRNRDFKNKVETDRRRRAVQNQLRRSPVLEGLSEDALARLADSAALVRYRAGETICRQGDAADAFYVMRLGHAKVEKRHGPGERVEIVRYFSAGHVFGEIGLLLPPYQRTTTVSALDDVELVRIAKADFDRLLDEAGGLRERLVARANDYIRQDSQRKGRQSLPIAPHTKAYAGDLKTEYFAQELYQGQSLLVLDLERCTRCDECVRACASTHSTITRLTRDGLRFDKYLVTTSCRSCHDPKCLIGCPVDAIHRKAGKAIVIDDHCVGCGKCSENCPYGNVTMHPVTRQDPITLELTPGRHARVCDLDNCLGEKEEPSCVYACPHDAALRIDGAELFERVFSGE